MFYPLQLQWFEQWSRSMEAALRCWATLAETVEGHTPVYVRELTDRLMGGTRAIHRSFGMFDPLGAKQARAVKNPGRKRVALVTGGIGGIGTEICRKLAQVGNRVIATYVAVEADHAARWRSERANEGYDIRVAECDVTDFDSCAKMAVRVEAEFGGVDVLINCAGITRDNTLRKMDKEHWHAVIDTNLDSVFNVTKNFIDGMVARRYGRIINISSVNGQKGQFGQTNYSAAKAGMIGFTRSLARELADQGITVNAVSPGYVATRMVLAVPEEIRQGIIAQIPLGRLAEPAEIAHAVAFLADEASGYITGADLSVNGGLFMA